MKNNLFIVIAIILSLILTGCGNQNPEEPSEPEVSPVTPIKPIEPVLDPIEEQIKEMTLEEKIGQLMIVGLDGVEINENDIKNIQEYNIGGFILFARNINSIDQLLNLLNSLKEENQDKDIPLFLSIDEEGGKVSRLSSIYTNLPDATTLGSKNDEGLSFRYGENLGMKTSSLGFNINFAPVVDVNSNPNNPVIGRRSYGNDAEIVSDVGIQVLNGIQSQNVIAVPKHFPGHGDTSVDSHLELPVVDKSIDELYDLELIPFKEVIDNGAEAIMVAHILYPQIDEEYPATMSEEIINGILREELGFDGLVISDDMTMGAIVENYTIEEAVVQFLKSGGDIALVCHGKENVGLVYNKILQSVNDGTLSEDEIDGKVYRILKLKSEYGLEDEIIEDVDMETINSNTDILIDDISR